MSHNYGIVPLKEECGDFLFENSRGNLNVVYLLGAFVKQSVSLFSLTLEFHRYCKEV